MQSIQVFFLTTDVFVLKHCKCVVPSWDSYDRYPDLSFDVHKCLFLFILLFFLSHEGIALDKQMNAFLDLHFRCNDPFRCRSWFGQLILMDVVISLSNSSSSSNKWTPFENRGVCLSHLVSMSYVLYIFHTDSYFLHDFFTKFITSVVTCSSSSKSKWNNVNLGE